MTSPVGQTKEFRFYAESKGDFEHGKTRSDLAFKKVTLIKYEQKMRDRLKWSPDQLGGWLNNLGKR